eukprot:959627-Pyramimonas_sp.AAC.1
MRPRCGPRGQAPATPAQRWRRRWRRCSSASRGLGDADESDDAPAHLDQWPCPTACQDPSGETLSAAAGAGR